MNKSENVNSNFLQHALGQVRVLAPLLPIMAVVFVAYLVIGLAMPVLPLHVHRGLGFGTFVVGLVAGSQFAATLISRVWAGHQADTRGARRAVVTGLLLAAAAGLLYLLSLIFTDTPVTSVAILLLGRALLGAAESFIVAGALVWGLALVGPQNTGTVLAQVGTAMYVAYAVGAPAGTALYAGYGFAAIALATTLIPLLTLLLIAPLRAVRVVPSAQARPPISKVIGAVWVPGVGLALSAVGFGAITTFIVLLFAQHGWGQGWLALTLLSVAFSGGRIAFGHLPDRIGGAKVALVCVLIEAAGQALIWLAPWPALALLGAALTGFGYSLVFPGLGVEAVRRVPPQSRGLATGTFTAFLDLALGVSSPALGLVAVGGGLSAVFLASTLAVLCAAAIAIRLLYVQRAADVVRSLRDRDRGACSQQTAARLALCAVFVALRLVYAPCPSNAEPRSMQSSMQTFNDVRLVAPALEKYGRDTLLGDVWRRPGLDARDRSIVTVAALITRNQTIEMPTYFNLALDNGVKPRELSEIITHLAFYSGWAIAMSAVAVEKDVFARREIGADQLPAASPAPLPVDEAGEAQRAERVGQQFGAVAPGIVQYTTDVLFRDLWLRPDLAPRDRSLVTISALIASGQVAQLTPHLDKAMDNGLTQAEAAEVITHLAFYVGWPNAFSALPIAKNVFEKRPR